MGTLCFADAKTIISYLIIHPHSRIISSYYCSSSSFLLFKKKKMMIKVLTLVVVVVAAADTLLLIPTTKAEILNTACNEEVDFSGVYQKQIDCFMRVDLSQSNDTISTIYSDPDCVYRVGDNITLVKYPQGGPGAYLYVLRQGDGGADGDPQPPPSMPGMIDMRVPTSMCYARSFAETADADMAPTLTCTDTSDGGINTWTIEVLEEGTCKVQQVLRLATEPFTPGSDSLTPSNYWPSTYINVLSKIKDINGTEVIMYPLSRFPGK